MDSARLSRAAGVPQTNLRFEREARSACVSAKRGGRAALEAAKAGVARLEQKKHEFLFGRHVSGLDEKPKPEGFILYLIDQEHVDKLEEINGLDDDGKPNYKFPVDSTLEVYLRYDSRVDTTKVCLLRVQCALVPWVS